MHGLGQPYSVNPPIVSNYIAENKYFLITFSSEFNYLPSDKMHCLANRKAISLTQLI